MADINNKPTEENIRKLTGEQLEHCKRCWEKIRRRMMEDVHKVDGIIGSINREKMERKDGEDLSE